MTAKLSLFALFLFAGSTAFTQEQGFFLNDWQAKTAVIPEYINTPQSAEPATVMVTVDFTDTITKVSKYIYGNNGVNWAGKMNTNAGLMTNIKKLQPHVLRWPGGNLSNQHFWDAVQDGGPVDIPPTVKIGALNAGMNTTNWAMTVNDYYEMLEKTNSTGCICVNYSYARYGTSKDPVAKAAHYAAEWVRYDNGRTKLWEIGNENGGPWQAGYEIDTSLNQDGQPKLISGGLYGRHACVFIDSMKAAAKEVGSEIKIGVVAESHPVTWNEVMKDWNKTMLPEVAHKADFLIVHSYFTPHNENSNVATILASPPSIKEIRNHVLGDLRKYTDVNHLPLALTEWNIFATGSGQAVSYINGLHATMIFGELIKNQYGQAMRWDLMNGWNDGNDHGLFARAEEPGVAYGEPHAPFYYMYYFQKYFGDHMLRSTVSGSPNVVAYASSFSSGESGIVLVNKGSSKQIVHLEIENMPHAKSYFRYVLTGGSDNGNFSRKVFVNGESNYLPGGGPANYETIKAFGKSIFGDIKIECPPLSATFVLLGEETVPPVTTTSDKASPSFKLFPNPSNGSFTIDFGGNGLYMLNIYDLSGRKIEERKYAAKITSAEKIDLPLKSGIYIVTVRSKDQQFSKKLVIK